MSSESANHRILIVDDQPAIHDDFRKILLEPQGRSLDAHAEAILFKKANQVPQPRYSLASAYQGKEAIDLVKRARDEGQPFAVAFVDVRMPPGLDGVETIPQLWAADPRLQVVLCTAYSDYSWQEITRKLDPRDNFIVLKKPFDNIEVQQLAHTLTKKWNFTHQAVVKLQQMNEVVLKKTDGTDWRVVGQK